jgi:hypothetical protein
MKEPGSVAQTGKRGNRSLCALERKEKPRAEAGRDSKRLCEALTSPEAAPHSTAHVSGAMARLSQAPVFVLTAPYASAPRIAMAVGTAAAERGYRFNRRQGGGRHRNAEQHQPQRLYKVHGYVSPIKARFRPVALYGSLRLGSSASRVECSRAATCGRRVRVSAGTNNGHRRIWLSCLGPRNSVSRKRRLSQQRPGSTGRLQRGQSKDLALTKPFGLLMCAQREIHSD